MKVFLKANVVSEYSDDGPRFASFEATEDFMERVKALRGIVKDNGLSSCTEWYSIDWHRDDEWRMTCEELVVMDDSFCFIGYPKHSACRVETGLVENDLDAMLIKAKADGKTDVYYGMTQDEIDYLIESWPASQGVTAYTK